jgi:fibronectin-binding autotransporter adhesin
VGGTAANVKLRIMQNSTVVINAAQNWAQGIDLNAGTLEISNTNALGGFSGGNGYLGIANGSTFRYTGTGTQTDGRYLWIDTSTDTKTIEITSATGGLEFTSNGGNVNKPLNKTGAGRLTIADDINSGAAVTVSAGTFRIGNGGGNGNLASGASVTGAGALEFYKTGNTTVGGTFGGSGPIRFMSTGASSQGHFQLDGNSSAYTGAVTIDLARLHLNSVNDVGSASSITVNNLGQAWITGGANIARPLSIAGIGWAEGAGNLGAIRIDSASTYSGAITLTGNARITTYGGGDTGTISGLVSDGASSFELEKSGDGILYLSNSGNTHDGGTKVSGGYLRITSDGALGATTGPLVLQTNGRIMGGTLAAGANVSLNASRPISLPNGDGYFHIWTGFTMDVPGPISGSGNMRKSDGGTLNFSGTGSVGTLRVEGGTYQQSGGSLNAGSNIWMSSTSTMNITGGTLSTARLVTSDNSGVLSIINHSAGTFNVTGSVNSAHVVLVPAEPLGLRIGASSTYNLSGGVLNAPNAPLNLGWDGTARLIQTGGTANLQGINFNNGRNNAATYQLTGRPAESSAAYGMNGNASAKWMDLNGGTLGAYANWSGGQQINVSATSTIDTLDSVDGVTGRTITLSGVLSGAGGITKAGAGTLILNNAANTYTGATTINAGTFEIGGGGRLNNGAYAGTITNNAVLYYNSTANQTLSGAIGGTGSLVKANTGNLTLSTANGYTGGTTVNAGTLTLSYNSGGTGTIRDGLTVNSGGTVVLAVTNALGWSGSNWVKTANVNGGTVRTDVNGDNGWDITWNLNGATLSNTNSGYYSINNTGGVFVTGNTTSTISGRIQLRGSAVNFNVADGTAAQDLLVSGEVFNNNGLQKTGAGRMVMTATNTYSGNTIIGAGTLEIGGGGSLGSGSYAGTLTNNGTLDINTTANQTLSGAMSGTGSLVKNSTGVLTITGDKTYSGLTTVNAGVLTASGAGTFTSTSGLAVADGAIFNYLPGTVGSSMTMGAGSTLTLDGGSILGLNWNGATASKIVASGAATIGSNVKVSMTGAYTSGQAYTILQAGSGLDSGSYTAINNVDYTAMFGQSATAVTITPTSVTPLSSAYWKGGTSGYESVMGVAGNWTTDGAGTVSALTPGATANVFFSDSGAAPANQLDMTLGANMALNRITVNGNSGSPVNTSPVSISSAGGYTLTLGSGAGAGIFVNSGSGPGDRERAGCARCESDLVQQQRQRTDREWRGERKCFPDQVGNRAAGAGRRQHLHRHHHRVAGHPASGRGHRSSLQQQHHGGLRGDL